MGAVGLDGGPDLGDVVVVEGAARQDAGLPSVGRGAVVEGVEGGGEGGGGALGGQECVAVGLVDDHEVGDLHDAALDALELVACACEHEGQEGVGELGDGELGLADADGLDEDDIEASGLADEHGLAGAGGDAAEGA